MATGNQKRRWKINGSNGHFEPVYYGSGDDYVGAIRCAYCGREYRTRFVDANEHLRKVHDVLWFEPKKED